MVAGVQILLRDYVFNGPGTFTAEDIVALVPVVQHSNFKVLQNFDAFFIKLLMYFFYSRQS